MELIIQNISKIISLTPEEEAFFYQSKYTKVKAKTILLSAGKVRHMKFGILRVLILTILLNIFCILPTKVGGWATCIAIFEKT
jgi:hypothetical protein